MYFSNVFYKGEDGLKVAEYVVERICLHSSLNYYCIKMNIADVTEEMINMIINGIKCSISNCYAFDIMKKQTKDAIFIQSDTPEGKVFFKNKGFFFKFEGNIENIGKNLTETKISQLNELKLAQKMDYLVKKMLIVENTLRVIDKRNGITTTYKNVSDDFFFILKERKEKGNFILNVNGCKTPFAFGYDPFELYLKEKYSVKRRVK